MYTSQTDRQTDDRRRRTQHYSISINQSISTNHLHKNDQWLTNKVKNNKTKIKPNE